jgi:AraC-like DNA-binding protein
VRARAELGIGERRLAQIFDREVGLSPKVAARVARLRRAVDRVLDGDESSWAAIATSSGYYDQAHMTNEFRALTGMSPSALADCGFFQERPVEHR